MSPYVTHYILHRQFAVEFVSFAWDSVLHDELCGRQHGNVEKVQDQKLVFHA